jgi:hypothetical protein
MKYPESAVYSSLEHLIFDHRSALAEAGIGNAFDQYGRQKKEISVGTGVMFHGYGAIDDVPGHIPPRFNFLDIVRKALAEDWRKLKPRGTPKIVLSAGINQSGNFTLTWEPDPSDIAAGVPFSQSKWSGYKFDNQWGKIGPAKLMNIDKLEGAAAVLKGSERPLSANEAWAVAFIRTTAVHVRDKLAKEFKVRIVHWLPEVELVLADTHEDKQSEQSIAAPGL